MRSAGKRDCSSCRLWIKCVLPEFCRMRAAQWSRKDQMSWCETENDKKIRHQQMCTKQHNELPQRFSLITAQPREELYPGLYVPDWTARLCFSALTFSGSESAKVQIVSSCILGVQIRGWHPALFFCCADKPPACNQRWRKKIRKKMNMLRRDPNSLYH